MVLPFDEPSGNYGIEILSRIPDISNRTDLKITCLYIKMCSHHGPFRIKFISCFETFGSPFVVILFLYTPRCAKIIFLAQLKVYNDHFSHTVQLYQNANQIGNGCIKYFTSCHKMHQMYTPTITYHIMISGIHLWRN